jgi:quercetin dioxygenase-like cupin family protein
MDARRKRAIWYPVCLFDDRELFSAPSTFLQTYSMKNAKLLFVAVFLLHLTGNVSAQQAYPTQELLSTGTTVVGETIHYPDSGPARVTASIVTIAPGADTVLHKHPVPMVAYILEGEVTVDYGEKGRKVFRQGEAMVEAMDTPHRGMNLGNSLVRILTIHIGADGLPNVRLAK